MLFIADYRGRKLVRISSLAAPAIPIDTNTDECTTKASFLKISFGVRVAQLVHGLDHGIYRK